MVLPKDSVITRAFGIVCALVFVGLSFGSASPVDVTKLSAGDAKPNQYFGFSVAIAEEIAVVGAQGDDENGEQTGAAYVFVDSGGAWSQQAKIFASDAEVGDQFGGSVALSGETVLVGARRDDDSGEDSGAAYVFERSGSEWIQRAKLKAEDGEAGAEFGRSVALSETTAVIGAARDDAVGEDSGSVYIFTRVGDDWIQETKLIAGDGEAGDVFGISVAIDGDTVLIGADLDDDNGENTGSVYVYVRTNGSWSQQAKLTASDAGDVDIFGVRVALAGETALIAARRDDTEDKGVDSGSAYVFVRSGSHWTEQAKLLADDGEEGDLFGYTVALGADTAVVTAAMDDDKVRNSGAAYVFTRCGVGWSQQAKVVAPKSSANDVFGWSVAISEETVIIGAPTSIHETTDGSGSAFIVRRAGVDWGQKPNNTARCEQD